jgi:hypothetical protein
MNLNSAPDSLNVMAANVLENLASTPEQKGKVTSSNPINSIAADILEKMASPSNIYPSDNRVAGNFPDKLSDSGVKPNQNQFGADLLTGLTKNKTKSNDMFVNRDSDLSECDANGIPIPINAFSNRIRINSDLGFGGFPTQGVVVVGPQPLTTGQPLQSNLPSIVAQQPQSMPPNNTQSSGPQPISASSSNVQLPRAQINNPTAAPNSNITQRPQIPFQRTVSPIANNTITSAPVSNEVQPPPIDPPVQSSVPTTATVVPTTSPISDINSSGNVSSTKPQPKGTKRSKESDSDSKGTISELVEFLGGSNDSSKPNDENESMVSVTSLMNWLAGKKSGPAPKK